MAAGCSGVTPSSPALPSPAPFELPALVGGVEFGMAPDADGAAGVAGFACEPTAAASGAASLPEPQAIRNAALSAQRDAAVADDPIPVENLCMVASF
ncbi:MAG: hypothetical protein ABI895_00985 [Deltaproteobacteria bacterium]